MKLPVIMPYLVPMNYRYRKDVDRFINDLLDRQPAIHKHDGYYVTFRISNSYISIWVANKWHAYAARASESSKTKGEAPMVFGTQLWDDQRPSRRTMIRLYEYIKGAEGSESSLALSKVLKEDINNVRPSNNQ